MLYLQYTMRCAQLAHSMYMYAQVAHTDLIYRNALRLSVHEVYVVPKVDSISQPKICATSNLVEVEHTVQHSIFELNAPLYGP